MQANNTPQPTRLIRLREVMAKTGLSKTSVYRLMDTGDLPVSVKLSKHSMAWREHEIDAWIESRETVSAPLRRAPKRKAAA